MDLMTSASRWKIATILTSAPFVVRGKRLLGNLRILTPRETKSGVVKDSERQVASMSLSSISAYNHICHDLSECAQHSNVDDKFCFQGTLLAYRQRYVSCNLS